ncbi:MAG: DUF354 domain-containing protein [Bacteroidales bacterium]|nr:DUF354 domain-containing protein [Bacteroidales bacterium]
MPDFFKNKTIWFDLENAPHVWILKEIINFFKDEQYKIIITARDFSSTIELCNLIHLDHVNISLKNHTTSTFGKVINTIKRSFLLRKFLKNNKIQPDIAISHGSRSQAFAAYLMRIPAYSLDDYEYSFRGFNFFVKNILTPYPILPDSWGRFRKKVINYPGIKEELYVWNKDNFLSSNMDFDDNTTNIIFRPQSSSSHYASRNSEILQEYLLQKFSQTPDIKLFIFPRNKKQSIIIEKKLKIFGINYYIPEKAVNGLAFIHKCDYVFSGGGTMAREACVLKTPSFSFFGGKLGAVDYYLSGKGELFILKQKEQIDEITFHKKDINKVPETSKNAFNFIVDFFREKLS